ncbi:MAG: hypothetical protein IPG33_02565 [Betaproteobacteria bacterium]|nr:hypothetical protein [Betaproteobacteria bacterium]
MIARDREIAWSAPMIGSWPLSWTSFLQPAGANAEDARMPQTFIEEPVNSRRTRFILTYLDGFRWRMGSAIAAAQAYDTMARSWPPLCTRPAPRMGRKLRAALENLQAYIHGVVSTYQHPFSAGDHEAITTDMVVMGEVRKGPYSVRA